MAAKIGNVEERAKEVAVRLKRAIPQPDTALRHEDPWQLLVATILSAQSTDRVVNQVTPDLFRRWPTPAELGGADLSEIDVALSKLNFHRNKAKSIQGTSRIIAESHGGVVPQSLDELVKLPGVARKTANVVLGTAFGIASGIVVDTHVARVSQRLGLSHHKDPPKIEIDLCELFPRRSWVAMGHRLLLHGRHVCVARKPNCAECPLNELCPGHEAEPEATWGVRADRENERVTLGMKKA